MLSKTIYSSDSSVPVLSWKPITGQPYFTGLVSNSGMPVIGFQKDHGISSILVTKILGEEIQLFINKVEDYKISFSSICVQHREIDGCLNGLSLHKTKVFDGESYYFTNTQAINLVDDTKILITRFDEGCKSIVRDEMNFVNGTLITVGKSQIINETIASLKILLSARQLGKGDLNIIKENGKVNVLHKGNLLIRIDVAGKITVTVNKGLMVGDTYQFYDKTGSLVVIGTSSN